jgi:hypothetical protein
VLHPRNEAKMTKVMDRLARREGRGFMTTLLGLGDFPSCFRRSYMRQIASPPPPWSCGMSRLRRKSREIFDVKELIGKIFWTKDLASAAVVL